MAEQWGYWAGLVDAVAWQKVCLPSPTSSRWSVHPPPGGPFPQNGSDVSDVHLQA